MTFERTRDLERVRAAIAGDERVWNAAGDDAAPDRAAWSPNADERIYYVIAGDERGEIALITLLPQNVVCYELHVTRMFGRREARALAEFFPWAWKHTPARRIVAVVPAANVIALRAVRRSGMTEFGRNPRAFLKNGALDDLVLLGVSPSE